MTETDIISLDSDTLCAVRLRRRLKNFFEMFAVVDPDQDDDVKSKFAFHVFLFLMMSGSLAGF